MIFKVIWEKRGGHIHCALFSAPALNMTYAKCGDFVVQDVEFDQLQRVMSGVSFKERL